MTHHVVHCLPLLASVLKPDLYASRRDVKAVAKLVQQGLARQRIALEDMLEDGDLTPDEILARTTAFPPTILPSIV